MTKRKGAVAKVAAPKPAPKPTAATSNPAHCAKSADGIHHWIDEVHGAGRVRTTIQRCQACGRKVTLGTEEV